MLRRIAHLFSFRKKDVALEKRFAQIKTRYLEAAERTELGTSDPMAHLRITGNFGSVGERTVNGAATGTREKITEDLLRSISLKVGSDS